MAEIIENHTNIIPEIKEENTFNETASEQQKNVWDVCNGGTVKTENPNDTDILVHTNEPVVDLPKSTITPEKNEKQDANGGLVLSGSKSIAADKTITSQPESQTLNQNDLITVPCQVLHELIDKIVVKSTESNGAQIETQLPNNHCEGTPTAAGPDKVDNNPAEVKSQRFPKRKRVPKKSQDIDECRKEVQKPSLPLDIKPKIPAIETPIIWNSADLVWAYVAGHPLWPCMITTDPIENLFTKMRGSGRAVRLYHVQFLGDSPERGWVTEQRIFSYYSPEDYEKIINEMIVKQRKLIKKTPKMEVPARLRPLWNSAIEEIAEAVPFTPDERIANFKYNFKPYTKILQKLPFKEENSDDLVPFEELLARCMLTDLAEFGCLDSDSPIDDVINCADGNFDTVCNNSNSQSEDSREDNCKRKSLETLANLCKNVINKEHRQFSSPSTEYSTDYQESDSFQSSSTSENSPPNLQHLESPSYSYHPSLLSYDTKRSSKDNSIVDSPVSDFTILAQKNKALITQGRANQLSTSTLGAKNPLEGLANFVGNVSASSNSFTDNSASVSSISTSQMDEKCKLFRDCLNLVAVHPSHEDSKGCCVTQSRAIKVAAALDESYTEPPPIKHYDSCSCTALNESRGVGRSMYTVRDLLDAIDCVNNGFPPPLVAGNFRIPRYLLTKYTTGQRSLMIKHHSDCGLFSGGKSVVIHGPAHHLKAMEENRRLRISEFSVKPQKSLPKLHVLKKVATVPQEMNPVVLLNRDNLHLPDILEVPADVSSVSYVSITAVTKAWNMYINDGAASKFSQQFPDDFKKEDPNYEYRFQSALKALVLGEKLQDVAQKFLLPLRGFLKRIYFYAGLQREQIAEFPKPSVRALKYSDKQMLQAIDEFHVSMTGMSKIGRKYNIPESTLRGTIDRNKWIYQKLTSELPQNSTSADRVKVMLANRNLFSFYSSDRRTCASKADLALIQEMKQNELKNCNVSLKNATQGNDVENDSTFHSVAPSTVDQTNHSLANRASRDFRYLTAMDGRWSAKRASWKIEQQYKLTREILKRLVSKKNRLVYQKLISSLPQGISKKDRLAAMYHNRNLFFLDYDLPSDNNFSVNTATAIIAPVDKIIDLTVDQSDKHKISDPAGTVGECSSETGISFPQWVRQQKALLTEKKNKSRRRLQASRWKGYMIPIIQKRSNFRTHRVVNGKLIKKDYTYHDLMKALKLVTSGQMKISEASARFHIPFSTLRDNSMGRHVSGKRVHAQYQPKSRKNVIEHKMKTRKRTNWREKLESLSATNDNDSGEEKNDILNEGRSLRSRPQNVMLNLTVTIEQNIAEAMQLLAKWNWWLNKDTAMQMISTYLNEDLKYSSSKQVTELWLKYFCSRNRITLQSQGIDNTNPDPFMVYSFFDKLEASVRELSLEDLPSQVYCIHELSLNKGDENETHIIAAVNAAGEKHPPMIVFHGDVAWCSGEKKSPFPGTQFALTSKTNVPFSIFLKWFQHFLSSISQRPLLLLYDGLFEHLPLSFIMEYKNLGICFLKFPYSCEISKFHLPYRKVPAESKSWYERSKTLDKTQYSQAQITNIVTDIWQECLTEEVIVSQFDTSGLFPPNREKYPAETFPELRLRDYCRSAKVAPSSPVKKRQHNRESSDSDHADNIDGSKQEKHKTPVKRLQTPKSNKSPADPLRGVKKSAGTKLSKSAKSVLLNATNQSDVNSNTKNALFNAYCRKHKPAVSAQNPQLTPEQVEALIWMEWEALSPEEQQKCIPDDPVVDPSSPQGKRKGRPPKKSLEPTDVVNPHRCGSCSASYLTAQSLGQHKRWCAGVAALKGVPLGKGSRKSTESLSPVKQMVNELLICSKCKESFHDKRSLAIHKKFCSAVEPVGKSPKPAASPLPRKKSAPHDDSSSNGSKADSEEAPSFKRTRVRGPQLGSNIKRENLCLICNGSSEDEELIHCIGGCCQSFHPGCLEDKVSSVAEFTCKHCKDDNHACFICKKNSSVETQLGEVKRCTVLKCGRSYHSECLIAWKTSLLHLDDEDDDMEKEKERQAMINSSKCTLHQCGTCTTKEKEDTNNVANPSRCKLFRCIKCPTAFHIGDECIAAGSIMLPGLNIICPDHFEPLKTTPHHQPVHVSWCFVCSKGGELMCCETCPASFHPICVGLDKTPDDEWFCRDCRNKKRPLYGEIVWVKLGSYRWWPGEITHPNEIPDNIQRLQHGIGEFVVRFFGSNDYFWLNKRRVFAYQEGDTGATSSNCSRGISSVFNKALQEAQESFEELVSRQQKIQDVKQQKKRPVYKHIKVNRPIGSVQIYTAELSEIPRCICKKTDPNPCGPESECLNRMLMYECHADLCPAGDKCQNQHFQKRDYPQSEVFKTTWGGWALKAKTLIKKGEFVSEYVGELVDGEECMRRIEHAHKNNVTNFYMLTIDKDRIIDAGPKGNYSRFMNHCCDPNCETQKWTVNGDTRVGLFALGEIAAGEELTFNYNLDCLGNDKTPCMCGSSNCSGFIGVRPKPQLGENGNGNNKSVKRKRRRNESKNLPKHDDFCFRCRQVGTLVCCDVRACQRAFCLACLRLTKPPFGKWQCPWHHCDFCGRRAQHFCHFCPNSFCASHVNNQLVPSVPNNYDCCTDHNPNVAEYEMEEAIASICASMLGPDDSAELDEDPETPPSPPEVSTPQKKKISTPKSTPVSTPGGSGAKKRGRPRKYKTDGDPSVEITSTPTKVEPMHSDANTESDGSDDDDLGPPTESPVRIKRIKRSYYTGRHKRKRRCSNPETPKAKTNESLSKNADASPLKSAVSTPLKNVLDKSGKMYTEL